MIEWNSLYNSCELGFLLELALSICPQCLHPNFISKKASQKIGTTIYLWGMSHNPEGGIVQDRRRGIIFSFYQDRPQGWPVIWTMACATHE